MNWYASFFYCEDNLNSIRITYPFKFQNLILVGTNLEDSFISQ